MADRITYIGLDVHKESIVVAVAEGGLRGEVREYGRIANTATALDRMLRKLGSDGMILRFCYEAGPCGYGIQRRLSTQGHECIVVAPSLIPKRAGDRVKTDRRDAASLAKLHRAGELTAVWVPDARHEAMRDLVRARLDAVHSLRRASGWEEFDNPPTRARARDGLVIVEFLGFSARSTLSGDVTRMFRILHIGCKARSRFRGASQAPALRITRVSNRSRLRSALMARGAGGAGPAGSTDVLREIGATYRDRRGVAHLPSRSTATSSGAGSAAPRSNAAVMRHPLRAFSLLRVTGTPDRAGRVGLSAAQSDRLG
jgi:hypothetical protein